MSPSRSPSADSSNIPTREGVTFTGGFQQATPSRLSGTGNAKKAPTAYCVFDYLYRDAGNYKAHGELLLEGAATTEAIARLIARLEAGQFFIAEQIGVPALCEELWRQCGCSPSDELDHVWHEFRGLRTAAAADTARLEPWGSLDALLARVETLDAWDLTRSLNWQLE